MKEGHSLNRDFAVTNFKKFSTPPPQILKISPINIWKLKKKIYSAPLLNSPRLNSHPA